MHFRVSIIDRLPCANRPAARPAAIADRHSLRSRLLDDGRGAQAWPSVRRERYLPGRHIHHTLTRGGPTNGVRSRANRLPQ